MPGRPTHRWVFGGLALALLAGCDSGDRGHPGTTGKAEVGPIPAYLQRPGDPAKGYDALVNRAVLTCGLPYNAYVRARRGGGDPGPQPPGRRGRNAELPYGLTAHLAPSGVELVTANCLSCHAATFQGRLILGLGNAFLEVQALVEPGQRLVLEARREDRVEDHESGDPPDPVASGDDDADRTDHAG